jgi:hypothetical protein
MAGFQIRYGRARPLTSEEAAQTLPSLVILLLMGAAEVIFPGSDTPSPARVVLIRPKGTPRDQHWLARRNIAITTTMALNGEQWQECMVPLIEEIQDPDGDYAFLNITNPLNRVALCHVGDAQRLMTNLGNVIRVRFNDCGYGVPT